MRTRYFFLIFTAYAILTIGAGLPQSQAATSCPSEGTIGQVQSRLAAADADLARKDAKDARVEYDTAMAGLQQTTWAADMGCDATRYKLLRYDALLHSLLVAVALNQKSIAEAADISEKLRQGLFPLPPGPHTPAGAVAAAGPLSTQRGNYPDIWKSIDQHTYAIGALNNAAVVTDHHPPGSPCAHPFLDAAALSLVAPEYPESAKKDTSGVHTVLVEVSLDAAGAVQSTSIKQSSGVAALDEAALRAARQSKYLPEVRSCQAVAGSYPFRATFEATP